jgi:hypothetical protein
MRCGLILFVTSLFVSFSSLVAQENSIFSGSGMRLGENDQNNPAGATRAFDFSSLGKEKEPNNRPLFAFPKLEMPKFERPKWLQGGHRFPSPIQLSDQNGNGRLFSNMPKFEWFGPRDPTQPNFFQRMNNRTKDFFGRTRQGLSDWASGTNRDVRDGTFDTWNSITQGTGGNASSQQPPAQPQLRSAQRIDGQQPDKY